MFVLHPDRSAAPFAARSLFEPSRIQLNSLHVFDAPKLHSINIAPIFPAISQRKQTPLCPGNLSHPYRISIVPESLLRQVSSSPLLPPRESLPGGQQSCVLQTLLLDDHHIQIAGLLVHYRRSARRIIPEASNLQPNVPAFFIPHCPAFNPTTYHPDPAGAPALFPFA